MMTLFSEKVLISNRCISDLMSNLIKKSWTDSIKAFTSHIGKSTYVLIKLATREDLEEAHKY